MKNTAKILLTILSLAIAITMFSGATIISASDITVELDGAVIDFDVNPQIINGRTMVPLRKIFEEIGAFVKWDDDTQTVSARKSSKTISLTIKSADLQIDKGDTDDEGNPIIETITLEVPAQIVSGRTLVPARAISEAFGLDVDWDAENNKVVITSEDDEDESWKENVGAINLSDLTYTGNGIEITDNQILITAGGDFTLTGTLLDGSITISAKEKVKLRLDNASITSSDGPCVFVEEADKAYLTLTEETENYLNAAISDDGAIYSKENLEIKGNGTLTVSSSAGHAIKASDNLTIENGNINLEAFGDGIHINDTFKMTGGSINITAVGDGIDSESIVDISGGKIEIETNGVPVSSESAATEGAQEDTQTTTDVTPGNKRPQMMAETQEIEFEKSSKGINAEWIMCISGGEITVNSASHTIHCEDEIEITGGIFSLSSKYEKGISAHGNLTIDNRETIIDITKSTEGIESKNILTINDGVITVVSTDDAINATGGNDGTMMGMGQNGGMRENTQNAEAPTESDGAFRPDRNMGNRTNDAAGDDAVQDGAAEVRPPGRGDFPMDGERPELVDGQQPPDIDMSKMPEMPQKGGNQWMPGGNMGGAGQNLKDCLIINGGEIELYAGDDCLDSNGNLVINGGTIKATKSGGSFSGPEGIIDPDGQTTISENATLILAAGNGNERNLRLSQNNIILYCDSSHTAGEEIIIKDSAGRTIYNYTPLGSFGSVLIASKSLEIGESYTITVGDEAQTVELTEHTTIIGTLKTSTPGRNRIMQ